MQRATVAVLDACGVGELPDADAYGDGGSNTLAHLASLVGGLELPTLERLGLGSIVPIDGVAPAVGPAGDGRARPLGAGEGAETRRRGVVGGGPARALPADPRGFSSS